MRKENQADTDIEECPNVDEIKEVIPAMNVNVPLQVDKDELISDEAIIGIYAEILDKLRSDRGDLDEVIAKFGEMVFNEGDATTSSKEALVNLYKLKIESADKMGRVADLMTRIKLRDRDTMPKYLAAHQNNTIHISDGGKIAKKALLHEINKKKKVEHE